MKNGHGLIIRVLRFPCEGVVGLRGGYASEFS
jgi:hypothetical protein